jgi:hypothetical protein
MCIISIVFFSLFSCSQDKHRHDNEYTRQENINHRIEVSSKDNTYEYISMKNHTNDIVSNKIVRRVVCHRYELTWTSVVYFEKNDRMHTIETNDSVQITSNDRNIDRLTRENVRSLVSTANDTINEKSDVHLPLSTIDPHTINPSDTIEQFTLDAIDRQSHEIQSSNYSHVDSDNDYIEPESPTGIDALLYDEDEDDEMKSNSNPTSPASSTNEQQQHHNMETSSIEHSSSILTYQPVVRDDYNPSRISNLSIPM